MALRTVSLCSGIGGLDFGLDLGASRAGLGGSRAVCMVEGEAFAAATLAAQMERGALAQAPIWSDLRTFDAGPWRGVVDCVVAGYPCQPFSAAGHRLGDADERHLWPDVARVVRELEPAWCFLENVGDHLSLGGHEVIESLQAMGFRVAAALWTAEEVGARHLRERLFILAAHPERVCVWDVEQRPAERRDDVSPGRQGEPDHHGAQRLMVGWAHGRESWATEPDIRRVAHGCSARVDRLRALGNAVVPEQAAHAFVELYNALTQG